MNICVLHIIGTIVGCWRDINYFVLIISAVSSPDYCTCHIPQVTNCPTKKHDTGDQNVFKLTVAMINCTVDHILIIFQ